ncbi:sugar ABC transporter substrate-binding protein [Gemmatimonadetes bacterium T265]|nr:sugar ABC transporter substrate-binding protein [Gemmatimonadetes bacterium T265]
MARRGAVPGTAIPRCAPDDACARDARRAGGRLRAVARAALVLLAACARPPAPPTLDFWALGTEGESVAPLVRDFERAHPGVRVRLQAVAFSAAHEKLLTAVVGDATPDVAQLGNTWIPEFAALRALEPLDPRLARSAVVHRADYFPGAWATNVVDGRTFGIPWYVDTRLVFYRSDLMARAGVARAPESWAEWTDAMRRLRRVQPAGGAPALLPLNEFEPPLIILSQSGAPLLRDHDTRGNFRDPRVRAAFAWYVGLFRDGLAPPVASTQVSNVAQEFGAGRYAMYVTGPWNVGEFRRWMPDTLPPARRPAGPRWATMAMPGPTGAASGTSLAGGSSLVLFRGPGHDDPARRALAWQFVEFLSTTAAQARFAQLSSDLPARADAWAPAGFGADPQLAPFLTQLRRLTPLPSVPEWESIATRVTHAVERAARGTMTVDAALAALDAEVDDILEKRRWLLARRAAAAAPTHLSAR